MPDVAAQPGWAGRRFSVRLMVLAAILPILTFGFSLVGLLDAHLLKPAITALAGGGALALALAVLLAVTMARNVARRQEAERRLLALQAQKTEERRLGDIARHFPGLIYRRVMDASGHISYPSVSGGAGLGLSDSAIDQWFHPEDRPRWLEAVRASAQTLRPFHCEFRLVTGDRWVRSAATPRRGENGSVIWDGVLFDVTDLKLAEEALKALLDQREAMLREIHHRVRNNLQVVSSLIQIEALHITDPEACRRMAEVSRRIGAMGHLHEQLYTSADLTSVDCGEHLRRLCHTLVSPYESRGLTVAAKVEPLRCDLDTAIPLGLVAHELLHAAAQGMLGHGIAGEIALVLRREGETVLLAVRGGSTDGVAALGDRILMALAAQLDGSLTQQAEFAVLRLPSARFDG